MGQSIGRKIEEWDREDYQLPKPFCFEENLTENDGNRDIPLEDKYLLNEDLMKLMDVSYPTSQYSREEQSKNLTDEYIGTNNTLEEAAKLHCRLSS